MTTLIPATAPTQFPAVDTSASGRRPAPRCRPGRAVVGRAGQAGSPSGARPSRCSLGQSANYSQLGAGFLKAESLSSRASRITQLKESVPMKVPGARPARTDTCSHRSRHHRFGSCRPSRPAPGSALTPRSVGQKRLLIFRTDRGSGDHRGGWGDLGLQASACQYGRDDAHRCIASVPVQESAHRHEQCGRREDDVDRKVCVLLTSGVDHERHELKRYETARR